MKSMTMKMNRLIRRPVNHLKSLQQLIVRDACLT